jgi:hypothetical protein
MWLSEIRAFTKVQLDIRFLQPFANQLENLFVGPFRIVKSWCVYKNDAGSVSLVVQNAISREILGNGAEAVFSPPPLLASECIDDLLMNVSIKWKPLED